jgi:hypothetical protein
MAACGAKNFHKVNFDLSAVWLDLASVFGQMDIRFSSFYARFRGKADTAVAPQDQIRVSSFRQRHKSKCGQSEPRNIFFHKNPLFFVEKNHSSVC